MLGRRDSFKVRNQPSAPAGDAEKRAASPLLVMLAMFLALLVAFKIADMWGYLPDVAEVESTLL